MGTHVSQSHLPPTFPPPCSWNELKSGSESSITSTLSILGDVSGGADSLSHPRPGRSETGRGKQVFVIRAPRVAWLPQAWGSQGLRTMSFSVDSSGETPAAHLSSCPQGKTNFLFFPISNNI